MMTVDVAGGDPLDHDCDTLVVGTFTGRIDGPGVSAVLDGLGLPDVPVTPDFRGDIGQYLAVASPGLRCSTVLFIGLGRTVATDTARLREAATVAGSSGYVRGHVVTTLALVHPTADAVEALAGGFNAASTRAPARAPSRAPDRARSRAADRADSAAEARVTILVPSALASAARRRIDRAATVTCAVDLARRLVAAPPNTQAPRDLADQIRSATAGACGADVYDQGALRDVGFGGTLGVARGSRNAPALLELRYEPGDALGHVVLCGLGVTFASGGLGLRRTRSIESGKAHMAGAAVVAAACTALDALGVRVQVTALLPLVEHLPDGDAQRPDDIVTTRGGLTIEITDAAQITAPVLADVLSLARAYEPDAIIDVSTGGSSVAATLGQRCGAVMGNDPDVVDGLLSAAAASGEQLWHLPMWDDIDRALQSAVADVRNHAAQCPPAMVTGLILRRVVGPVPWAHIDCGNAAFRPPTLADDDHSFATGFGVATLLRWLEHRATT